MAVAGRWTAVAPIPVRSSAMLLLSLTLPRRWVSVPFSAKPMALPLPLFHLLPASLLLPLLL